MNPYMEFTPEELAKACMQKAKLIQERPHRTPAGDDIALLLIACGHTLDPPETPEETFSGR
jgi:hypothetical protein